MWYKKLMFRKMCPACGTQSLSHDEQSVFCTHCPIYRVPLAWYLRPFVWARNRQWWWRLPLVAWFALVLADNLKSNEYALNRLQNPLSALDYGIHELGHFIFVLTGEFMTILGGSLFQCLFPLLWMFGFLQKKWYFAASLCWCWLGLNLFDVAMYAGDARARLLPLVGPGSYGADPTDPTSYDKMHDWYQLLNRTGHLDSDLVIAHGLRVAAVVCFVVGLALAGMLMVQMFYGTMKRFRKTPQGLDQN